MNKHLITLQNLWNEWGEYPGNVVYKKGKSITGYYVISLNGIEEKLGLTVTIVKQVLNMNRIIQINMINPEIKSIIEAGKQDILSPMACLTGLYELQRIVKHFPQTEDQPKLYKEIMEIKPEELAPREAQLKLKYLSTYLE